MEKWLAACDFIENEKYQKRSRINSQNRGKMPFSHTSGRTPILSRYKEMDEQSEIELFKETRVSKKRGGEFVNEYAQSLYDDMVKLKRQSLDKDEELVSEAEIVKSKLGHKSGYVKGMGHGLHVLRGSSSNAVTGTNMKGTLTELENAKEKIRDLSDAYEEQNRNLENQKIALEACEEKYSDEINTLKAQVAMMQKFMQKMSGIPSDLFHD